MASRDQVRRLSAPAGARWRRVRLITKGGYNWTERYPWIVEAALKNRHQQFVINGEAVRVFAGCSSSGKGWSAWSPVLTSLCWLARYSQVIAFAAALLAGFPGKDSATPATFARDWQIFKFIVAHDFIPTNWPTGPGGGFLKCPLFPKAT